jgi:uncharacterized protein
MKIAVIGSGIAGLSAAYYLSKKYEVDLFEQDNHFGGHSYTYDIKTKDNKIIPVDLGFIVFNELTYPNLFKFFDELEVSYEKSDMSFAVSIKDSVVEYGGRGIKALFSNKLNFINIKFLKMIWEIVKFYKNAPSLLNKNIEQETLGSYLKKSNLSQYFINFHIIPMVSAIWSMPFTKAKEMPLKLFLNFFINHGLFRIKNRPQWYTVSNRSRTYVKKVLANISGEYFKNYKVKKIIRNDDNVKVIFDNEFSYYDQVVLATHADQSLEIIENATKDENEILTEFKYVSNIAYLHTDSSFMPIKTAAWSSWNSISKNDLSNTCVTYWLNNLQNIKTDSNYFLTLNPIHEIDKTKIIKKINFTHPYLNSKTFKLQKDLFSLQGRKRTWFCGSYFGYGFHEDGLNSTLSMLKYFKN